MKALILASLSLVAFTGANAQAPAAQQAAAVSTEQIALARKVAARVLPEGAYRTVMRGAFNGMVGNMMSQMLDVPVRRFVAAAGLPEKDLAKLGETTTRQIMAIIDPAYEQRMKITMQAMMDGMGDLLAKMEPDIREGLAEAYASRFSIAQLGELDHFFATPTGTAFAGQQFTIMTDPALIQRMQSIMPTMIQALPDMMKKAQAATASLPKPKTAADLTDADRARLATLLGVSPSDLNRPSKEPSK